VRAICFQTADNGFYGWGQYNCQAITQLFYENTGAGAQIPLHEPPMIVIPEEGTNSANQEVPYGEKYMLAFAATSSQGYELELELKHAPVDAKMDSYNNIVTWEALLLGKFRFDIIAREKNATFPQETSIRVTVQVNDYIFGDYGLQRDQIKDLTAKDIAALDPEALQAFRKLNIEEIKPAAFEGLTADHMFYMTYSAISVISPAQFAYLPASSLIGVKPASLGGFSDNVLSNFTKDHINALDPTVVFAKIPGEDITKIVTNLKLDKISVKDINDLLPPTWFLDPETRSLTVPGGVPLTLKALDANPAPPPKTDMPRLPKLSSGLALGGDQEDGRTILDGMNETLAQKNLGQFQFAQDNDGIVNAQDETTGRKLAFIPNSSNVTQESDDTNADIKLQKRGVRIVTTDKQALSLIPAPKSMNDLKQVIPDGNLHMGENGDVIFNYANVKDNRKVREDNAFDVVVICEFDAFVDPIIDDFCANLDEYELSVCDTDLFSDEEVLGVHITRNKGRMARAGGYQSPQGRINYTDSTAQTIYPTIIEPNIFLTMLHQIDGLETVEVYQNGSYLVEFAEKQFILQPDFTATAHNIPETGQLVPPAIHFREGGYLEYEVESKGIEYTQKVFVYPFLP